MDCFPGDHGQSHLVTLFSDKDYAGNFVGWLPQALKLTRGFYDVGVLDLRCYRVPSPESSSSVSAPEGQCSKEKCEDETEENPVILQKPAPTLPKLFPGLEEPQIDYARYVYETRNELMPFSLHISNAMKTANYPARIGFNYIDDHTAIGSFRTTIDANPEALYVLPQDIALTMGFSRRCFRPGQYNGERMVTKAKLAPLGDQRAYTLETITNTYTENLIVVKRLYKELVVLQFAHADVNAFLEYISTHMKERGCNVTLEALPSKKVKLTYNPTQPGEYFAMPARLKDIFGFVNVECFKNGDYVSEFSYSKTLFSKLRQDEKIVVEMGRYQEFSVPMKEPSTLDYHHVIDDINESFTEWNYDDLRPAFKLEDGNMFCENISDCDFIQLPAKVNEFFGIPSDTKFTRLNRIFVGDKIRQIELQEQDDQTQREISISLPPQPPSAQEILILLDIVENQQYGNKTIPVVQHARWDINSDLLLHPQPVLYLPLCCEHVNCVRVTLTDAYLTPLRLKNFVTIVRLHFKPRFS